VKSAHLILSLCLMTPIVGFAGFSGKVSFSEKEKSYHLSVIETITEESGECLRRHIRDHQRNIERDRLTLFYGSLSRFSKYSLEEKKIFMQRRRYNLKYLNELKPISCIGMTMTCLEEGFLAAGSKEAWKKVDTFTRKNNLSGLALQEALSELGWKVLYWNSSPEKNREWDEFEKKKWPNNDKKIWGYHQARYSSVVNKGRYYFNRVDDAKALVGFGRKVPNAFKKIPLYVATAHTGYHVFPGVKGKTIEAHGSAELGDKNIIESKRFNPERSGLRSGLMVIPPGFLSRFDEEETGFFGLFKF